MSGGVVCMNKDRWIDIDRAMHVCSMSETVWIMPEVPFRGKEKRACLVESASCYARNHCYDCGWVWMHAVSGGLM